MMNILAQCLDWSIISILHIFALRYTCKMSFLDLANMAKTHCGLVTNWQSRAVNVILKNLATLWGTDGKQSLQSALRKGMRSGTSGTETSLTQSSHKTLRLRQTWAVQPWKLPVCRPGLCMEIILKIKTCILFSVRWKKLCLVTQPNDTLLAWIVIYGFKNVTVYLVYCEYVEMWPGLKLGSQHALLSPPLPVYQLYTQYYIFLSNQV